MKKYILSMGIILASLFLLNLKSTHGLSLEDYKLNINSNEILSYIKNENLENISELCTTDFCDYLRSNNLEEAIEIFKAKYQKFLETKTDEETALSTILKGFPITKINTLGD